MTLLAQHAGNSVPRDVFIKTVAKRAMYDFDPRRLEVCISRLKRKLMTALNPQEKIELEKDDLPIKSVRGVGYVFTQLINIQ